MSYILDALRRSEAERKQGQVPDLISPIHMIPVRKKQAVWWPYGLGAALLVNAGVMMYVFWPQPVSQNLVVEPLPDLATGNVSAAVVSTVKADTPDATTSAIVSDPENLPVSPSSQNLSSVLQASPGKKQVVMAPEELEPEEWLDEQEPQRIDPGSRVDRHDADESFAPRRADTNIPVLMSLPLDVQRRVPDLRFNSHIYSLQASARRVMINNILLREGDRFSGLQLLEITDEGVVMSVDGITFTVGVIADWTAPR